MNAKLVGLLCVIAAFGALTALALAEVGYIGLLQAALSSYASEQVFADLVISLVIALGFIQRDARERGIPFTPYVVATLFLGSFGPLGYFVHRELASTRSAGPGRVRRQEA